MSHPKSDTVGELVEALDERKTISYTEKKER
jgi:hypothetical protein